MQLELEGEMELIEGLVVPLLEALLFILLLLGLFMEMGDKSRPTAVPVFLFIICFLLMLYKL